MVGEPEHEPGRDTEVPRVEIVFESERPAGDGAPEPDRADHAPGPHSVGHDPLGAMAASVANTIEQLRRQRLETRAGGSEGTRGSHHDHAVEQQAQIMQATTVDVEHVIGLLSGPIRESTGLRLAGPAPSVRNGVVLFDGYLALRPAPLRRRIELRVYPTTSGNLTVLELLPRRSWPPQTRQYLRAGVPAISDLTDRIEASAAGTH